MLIKEIFATLLSIAVVVGVLWGIVWGFLFAIDVASSWGANEGLLYFIGGIAFAANYRNFWKWYLGFAEEAWIKIHGWIGW